MLLTSNFLDTYQYDAFSLKRHLQTFLQLDAETLDAKLEAGQAELAKLGHHFEWERCTDSYRDDFGCAYLFDLGAWHLQSKDYISDTLRLIRDHARGRVLDFGGGIGTHAIAAAQCPNVTEVIYCDINPINRDFVAYRAEELGLSHVLHCCLELEDYDTFDTILCFDVLEHLPNPQQQLIEFHKRLATDGKALLNWYFSKGFNHEYPFHLDDPAIVKVFFETLQQYYLEQFHPYLITARVYGKR